MTPPRCPDSAWVSRRPGRRGAVMVVVLLGLTLLAGILFYVVNLTRHTVTRTQTQAAADAAAGSGRVARTFNLVAMHNVGTAKMIALVAVLDAMPQSIAFAHEDQAAALEAVETQLGRGVDGSWVRQGLERFAGELAAEVALLAPMDDFFNGGGYDIREMTHYDGPTGRGRLWRSMEAMQATSVAAMSNLEAMAAIDATRGGQVNLEDARSRAAMLVPAVEAVPWVEGVFDDFERPVLHGLLPEWADDPVTNRGPYDTVFGWRDPVDGEIETRTTGSQQLAGEGSPGVPLGRGPNNDVTSIVSRRPDQYRVHGPMRQLIWSLRDLARPHLPHARFADYQWAPRREYYANNLADQKLAYCWPGVRTLYRVVNPDWVTSFDTATTIGDTEPQRIVETAYVVVEIKSLHRPTHPAFLTPGTWAYVETTQPLQRSPRLIWSEGWIDPRPWTGEPGVTKLRSHQWRDQWEYTVLFDEELGLEPAFVDDDPSTPVVYTIHRIDDYIFAGVNVGDEEPVTNPYNFGGRSALPGPVDFDHRRIDASDAAKRRYLTFLGVASRDSRALLWSEGFDGDRPDTGHVATAQANVFNNHSFDLWTPMWYAQGQRITGYENWVSRMATMDVADVVDRDAAEAMARRLRDAAPLAEHLLSH